MACHVLTNSASESLGNSVAKFEYLRLSCQGSSQNRYKDSMSDGGCGEHEVRGTGSDFRHAPDLW